MAISREEIEKAAREAAIRVIKPAPCLCGLGTLYTALDYRQVREYINEENLKEFMRTSSDLQERIERLKDYCGITIDEAELHLMRAETLAKEENWADAAASARQALWDIDGQLTNGAIREIKETE